MQRLNQAILKNNNPHTRHTETKMTKTPFEIRFDLLNFDQNQLTSEYYAALERAREISGDNRLAGCCVGLEDTN